MSKFHKSNDVSQEKFTKCETFLVKHHLISGFPRMSRYRDFPRMPRYKCERKI